MHGPPAPGAAPSRTRRGTVRPAIACPTARFQPLSSMRMLACSGKDTKVVGHSNTARGMVAFMGLVMPLAAVVGIAMPTDSERAFVYVGNSESQDITVFELSGAALQLVATVAVPGPKQRGTSLPLAVSPDRRFLYAGLRNQPYSVVTFSIDAKTGTLAYDGRGPLANSMAYIVTDRTGRYLLAASYDGDEVTVSPIGADGIVQPAQQVIPTLPH